MASSYGTDADKSSLRSNYLAVRGTLPQANRATADARIREALSGFELFERARVVLAYVSFGPEVDTRTLIGGLLAEGRRVAVPRVERAWHKMSFSEIASFDELSPGTMGILEPPADTPKLTVPDMVRTVCLVPGLVFDGAGRRVGYGGGYYDRFLAFYPGEKIGLARATMLSSNPLPADALDVPVDFIATEGSVWNCRAYR
ncbi:5-formyltetrahydrofolate cyclo-ligase [Olsenella profusa]|uniref:5-formyltetrahydrofolate cyclo-ligase n=1 Tax=Olsenella profusa TaxID=138595 RepID=A0ABS2EZC6_9ACTN|nr:5-formyltetrahydrofolate cyclo-ligase [Olsenella profusa]